jgi:metal-sulfur cluster biosynthetic enzyme
VIERAALLRALGTVRDPELDEPLTELGFVQELDEDGGRVEVRLRLPTYFCAPNFAYLMAADARAALLGVPGVSHARVTLVDHFAAREVNAGVGAELGFADAFDGLADGELGELRDLFRRKAFVVRQERVCRALGLGPEQLASLRLGDLPASPEVSAYLERRAELGVAIGAGEPFLVRPNGDPVPEAAAGEHVRFARTVRVSIEGNAELCRGLLDTRYAGARGIGERAAVAA